MKKCLFLVVLVLCLSTLAPLSASAKTNEVADQARPPRYEAIPLKGFDANGINNAGVIVGGLPRESVAALWFRGKIERLGTFGYVGSKGLAINARRDLLISVWNINLDEIRYSPEYLFVRNGKATKIEWPRNYDWGHVEALNNRGQIVGWVYQPATETYAACLWNEGKVTDVVKIGSFCNLRDINNRGQAVGSIGDINSSRAFLYENRQPIILPTPPWSQSAASAINDAGWIAGTVITENGQWLAVVWLPDGTMTILPSLEGQVSSATDINNRGEIVGESQTAQGERRFCLWQNSRVFDLERCLKTPLLITLVRAINDRGQILCYGRPQSGPDGYFLLQPVGGRRW